MQSFLAWIKTPFTPSMSAYQWFLFYGLILVIALLWHYVVKALSNV